MGADITVMKELFFLEQGTHKRKTLLMKMRQEKFTKQIDYYDRLGSTMVVMRPGYQNSTSNEGQIKYLVYSLEKAIMNMG
ncbi:hypothetical protein ACET3Z_025911 [Daucus carota]